ncbi:MAG: hypothetical protein K5829_01140 [Treponema sp.]|nr:hypothetical protein [Treponema sp.]
MKKKFGFMALIIGAAMMFSSCEIFALFNLAKDIADYNSVYVKNGTGSSISLKYEEDENTVTEEETPQSGTITIKKGATKEKAFTAGYFKLTIDDIQVIPGSGASDYVRDEVYYSLNANSIITITGNATDGYTYSSESRSSD